MRAVLRNNSFPPQANWITRDPGSVKEILHKSYPVSLSGRMVGYCVIVDTYDKESSIGENEPPLGLGSGERVVIVDEILTMENDGGDW